MMTNKQRTIKNEISLSGVGLHTGNTVNMTFKPATVNHGFAFVRIDLEGKPIIGARAEYVTDTKRGTNLEKNGVQIQTSEHVLAAAVGLGIDNLLIEIDASEPPIMDGSSKYFIEALERAGIQEQEADVKEYIVKDIISYKDEITGKNFQFYRRYNRDFLVSRHELPPHQIRLFSLLDPNLPFDSHDKSIPCYTNQQRPALPPQTILDPW